MIKCPVCGKGKFNEVGDFDVCQVCGWENDGLQYECEDYAGGANEASVNMARDNYMVNGNSEKMVGERIGEEEQKRLYGDQNVSMWKWIICPVCGKHKLDYSEHEKCDGCGWELDPVQALYQDCLTENKISVKQAKEVYEQYGNLDGKEAKKAIKELENKNKNGKYRAWAL